MFVSLFKRIKDAKNTLKKDEMSNIVLSSSEEIVTTVLLLVYEFVNFVSKILLILLLSYHVIFTSDPFHYGLYKGLKI